LKHFRDRYDSEKGCESIMDTTELTKQRKEVDKLILNAIRLSIMADEQDKVFQYLDMLNFTQSLRLCVKLCNSLQQNTLSNKVSQYLKDKEQRTIIEQSRKKTVPMTAPIEKFDSRQVGGCLNVEEAPKTDLA
jgi:3-methyladenine DNA glycosylase Tag